MTDEELTGMLGVTVRVGCRRMIPAQLAALADSVAQTESVPAKPWWDRKALAHAEAIGMLGDLTGDPALIRLAGLAAGRTYDLAVGAGPAADGIILASRRRLLRHLRAGDADAAEREITEHLRTLSLMVRLSGPRRPTARRTPAARSAQPA